MEENSLTCSDEPQSSSTINALDAALDELGLLSAVTEGRHEYMREKQYRMAHHCNQTLFSHRSGRSIIPSPSPAPSSLLTHISHRSNEGSTQPSPSSCTEKENTFLSGLKVLTMNSRFITNFKSEYTLPEHVTSVSAAGTRHSNNNNTGDAVSKFFPKRLMIKRSLFKRKRLRTHPYDGINSSYHSNYLCGSDDHTTITHPMPSTVSTCHRLRTASLSSGTCDGRRGKVSSAHSRHSAICCRKDLPSDTCEASVSDESGLLGGVLMRSRSMEELSNSSTELKGQDPILRSKDSAIPLADRTKDLVFDNMSLAIQQMCVRDTS